jgi:hypothetical protein
MTCLLTYKTNSNNATKNPEMYMERKVFGKNKLIFIRTSVINGSSRIQLKGVLFKNSSDMFMLPDDPSDR